MARVHLCRLLREKGMQIEEPFQLLGAGPNSKILMTLQLRVCLTKYFIFWFIFLIIHLQ